MIVIGLGSEEHRKREERYADGALVVCSPRGVRPTERAMLHALPTGKSGAALVLNSAEAVTGMALRALNPELSVHCHYDDAWHFAAAEHTVAQHPDLAPKLGLAADPPEGPWNLVCLPFERDGVAELLREWVRRAAEWLRPGGLLVASSDNSADCFVRDTVKAVFGSPTIVPGPSRRSGVAYIARRPKSPKTRQRDERRSFTVREGERDLPFVSRPGVFCHGRLDAGTRALLALMDVGEARRILDLGCGVGVVGIVAALRAPGAHVTMVDSHARAVECAQANAEANGVADRCEVVLTADALADVTAGYDLVLSNPPYYGNYRIAEMFLHTARRVLEPGGRIVLVTKGPEWYNGTMTELFGEVETATRGGYAIMMSTMAG